MSLNVSSFPPGCLLTLSKDKWQSVWSLTTPLTHVVDDIESLTRFLSFLERVSVIVLSLFLSILSVSCLWIKLYNVNT